MRGESVMLDLGANIECDAENLVQFALMGDVFARTVLGLAAADRRPAQCRLGGSEGQRRGARRRRPGCAAARSPIRFHGFVEGDDIAAGTVDVIVTDGFTGNVALKTAEGTAKLFAEFAAQLVQAFDDGAHRLSLCPRRAAESCATRLDPRRYNGAMFLGLARHRGEEPRLRPTRFGFANAIGVAIDMKMNGFLEKIRDRPGAAQRSAGAGSRNRPRSEMSFARRLSAAAPICPSGSSPMTSWRSRLDTSDEWIRQRTGIARAPHRAPMAS